MTDGTDVTALPPAGCGAGPGTARKYIDSLKYDRL